jgi:hypothetical protein
MCFCHVKQYLSTFFMINTTSASFLHPKISDQLDFIKFKPNINSLEVNNKAVNEQD